MKKDLYYSAVDDRWTCVSDQTLDAAEFLRVRLAVLKKQYDMLMAATDPGSAEILRKSIVALTEGRITQTLGAQAPEMARR